MDTHNLIKIGRFGYNYKDDGTFEIRVYANFQACFLSIDEFFVIINDEKIRFVVTEGLCLKGTRLTGKFQDQEIISELRKANKAWLAVDSETYDFLSFSQEDLIGRELFYQDKKIGIIADIFNNRAHDVLVVTLNQDEKSIMIPDVDEYVIKKDYENNKVVVKNIQELIDL
ncbi:MAG: hypothetical protein K0B81_08145 [Candidatus Cloacimonetes bacterium]|nr:hypothetical protein [Candidatus Cloacimonadota bacterium]